MGVQGWNQAVGLPAGLWRLCASCSACHRLLVTGPERTLLHSHVLISYCILTRGHVLTPAARMRRLA